MAGRERRHLVEEEQRRVAVAPDRVLPLLERSTQQIHWREAQRRCPKVRSSR